MVHSVQPKMGKTNIGMANYEKQVQQEAAYPIPISSIVYHHKEIGRKIESGTSLLQDRHSEKYIKSNWLYS